MRCRARVCSECATKVDGINYCVSCLADLAQGAGARAAQSHGALRAYLSAAGYLLLVTLLVWGLLEVTFANSVELVR